MKRRAFTMVEVLVVAGVTSVLIALSLTGVRGAQQASRSVKCKNNLRQMVLASHHYGACSQGHVPPAILYYQRQGVSRTVAWDFEIQNGQAKPGSLWKFTDRPQEVQQCPDCPQPDVSETEPFTGYHYNTSYLAAEGLLPETTADGFVKDGWKRVRAGVSPGQWRRTAETAMFADGGWARGANKFMRAPSATVENDLGMVYAGGSAFRHREQCHVAWLDAHVESVGEPFQGIRAQPGLLKALMDWPNNGFLSNDDSAYDPR